jgi:hypothetical protein
MGDKKGIKTQKVFLTPNLRGSEVKWILLQQVAPFQNKQI